MTNLRKLFAIFIFVLLMLIAIFIINYVSLQRHMQKVISDDPRNSGIKVWVHYKWFINPTELKYDLRSISNDKSALDVNRVMFQFSEKIKDKNFSKVYLSYKGEDKFYFTGNYFQKLGQEYEFQNPIYTLRTMPENVYSLNGDRKYGVWEGGFLGVINKQMEDLNTFSKEWYLKDMVEEIHE